MRGQLLPRLVLGGIVLTILIGVLLYVISSLTTALS